AKVAEFQQAREYLDRLPDVPTLVVPGNHDVPLYRAGERLRKPLANYQRFISEEVNPTLQHRGLTICGLDSTAPHSAISNGKIHSWQLDHCRKVFEAASDEDVRVVVAHHHFAAAPDSLRDRSMPRSRRAIECFNEMRVEMILGGHLHRAFIGNSLDFYPGSDRQRGIIIVHSGTSTSRRGRGREQEKNSFNLIRVSRTRFEIDHYMYFDSTHGFRLLSRHQFPRPDICLSQEWIEGVTRVPFDTSMTTDVGLTE
ncbi:MAG: metallophosphoesterase, partial [Planctomycetaceae bacterium]